MNDNGSRCKLTIDGMDVFIKEQRLFCPKWWSHKSNRPGLRYEIGICIQTGWICWFNGPFLCGSFSDSRISMEALIYVLRRDEKVQADTTYGSLYHETPDKSRRGTPYERMKAKARARHETINGRIKVFGCLSNRWRHPLKKHGTAFGAVANIIQVQIEKEGTTFGVQYDDNRIRPTEPRRRRSHQNT